VKILQLVQTLDPSVGGVAPAVLSLSRGLAREGHKIDIVALDNPTTPWLADIELTVHALGAGFGSYRYSRNLTRWLRENGAWYDCVIVNGLWQHLSFAAWRFCRARAIPYYVFPHGMLDPWFKRTFPLKHFKKWLYWPWAEYRVLRDATAVIFTSEEERLQARRSFWLYRCNEEVSPLGLEAPPPISARSKDAFLSRYPQLRDTRILLFLGRLHPKKGCDILIEALPRQSDSENLLSLVLAGPDQIGWEKYLRARIARLDIAPRIVFTGMLEGELKQGALAAADAFILPSHQENFGMAVVEALAAGLPVLISERVNIWREIDNDHAGYVESDDLPGTTRLIERWMATPPAERERMRTNAKTCFARRFEIGHAVASLLRILNKPRVSG
jgi:glycosyltransferase involved in cell wall biosynthesis